MKQLGRHLLATLSIAQAAVLLTACRSQPVAEDARTSQQRRAVARFHMRMHGDGLRDIERALLTGDRDEATTLALALAGKTDAPDLVERRDLERRVVEAALEVAHAPSIDEALRREPRVATACAACHRTAHRPIAWSELPPLRPDIPTPAARMSRHVWATDRLWEGLIGPSDERWRLGLRVLAETPLPFAALTDANLVAGRIQELARAQLASSAGSDGEARADAYGQLLIACAACHETLHVTAVTP